MNQSELKDAIILGGYVDEFGLVKPHKTDGSCDNGVLYTSVFQILANTNELDKNIRDCYLEPGLLNRKPKSIHTKQEQWDDLLGRSIRCIQSNNKQELRQILWYGIKHFGVYNTDGKLESKDFLWRFWFLFAFLIAGAFPLLKWIVRFPLFYFINSFKCDTTNDTSGLQLEWLMAIGYDLLYKDRMEEYWKLKLFMNTRKKLSDILSVYYESNHPFVLFIKENRD